MTVMVLHATVAPALAQSVLERVLGMVDNASNLAQVNGTYANIAENLGGTGVVETMVPGQVEQNNILDEGELVLIGYIYFQDSTSAGSGTGDAVEIIGSTGVGSDIRFGNGDAVYGVAGASGVQLGEVTYFDDGESDGTGYVISSVPGSDYATELGAEDEIASASGAVGDIGISVSLGSSLYSVTGDGFGATLTNQSSLGGPTLDIAVELVDGMVPSLMEVQGFYGIDGSINNTVAGVVESTARVTASLASATEFTLPTMNFGDMATTALGAVNTGGITLGVNSAVDEAKTTYTNAISAALTQIGGSVDTGAIVINVASNMSAVDGSITNVMDQVNGSIGTLSTTALGAVNTGTIVIGVDAVVQGIVGMSGQSSF